MSISCPYSTSVPISVNIPPVNAAAAAGITTKAAKCWSVLERKQCPLRTRRTQVLWGQGNEVTKWQSCLCETTVVGNFRSQEVPPENKRENAKALHLAGIALLLEVCSSHHSQLLNYVGWQISEGVQNTGGMILTEKNKIGEKYVPVKLHVISSLRRGEIGSSVFWDVSQRRLVAIYRRFEKTYRSHPQGPSRPQEFFFVLFGPWRC